MCVTETESMATVCLSPHSPPLVRGGHLHAFDERVLLRSTNDMRNVWFGVLDRGKYQGWIALINIVCALALNQVAYPHTISSWQQPPVP